MTGRKPHPAFGRNLRTARHARHWTRDQAAAQTGLGRATIQRAEDGDECWLSTAITFARVYETTLDALLNGETDGC